MVSKKCSNKIDATKKTSKLKRKKTFTGCWTCRSRKIKCDLKKPACANCKSYNINCGGYDIKLIWSNPIKFDSSVNIINNFETNSITNSFDSQKRRNIDLVRFDELLVYEYYEDIDDELSFLQSPPIDKIENGSTLVMNKFGVFKKRLKLDKGVRIINDLDIDRCGGTSNLEDSFSEYFDQTNEWISNELKDDFYLSASAVQGVPIYSTLTHQPENETTLHNAYKVSFHNSSNSVTSSDALLTKPSINNDDIGIPTENIFESSAINKIVLLHDEFNFNAPNNESIMPALIMEIESSTVPEVISKSDPLLDFPTTALKINGLARFLLNYYLENVADLMTVVPINSNPWKTLYFPTALKALGDLAGLGYTSSSRNSILNALLAVSCFNLQVKFPKYSKEMLFYLNLGIHFRNQASVFLKNCLNSTVKSEKYKDVLIAILSMNSIDVVWGTMSDCQYHLTICEDFIESRIKIKPHISKKARTLHSIFSFLKLIQDSTSLDKVREKEIVIHFNIDKPRDKYANSKVKDFFSPTSYNSFNMVDGKFQSDNNKYQQSLYPLLPIFTNITSSSYYLPGKNIDSEQESKETLYGLPNSLILLFSDCVLLVRHYFYFNLKNIPISNEFVELCVEFESRLINWEVDWNYDLSNVTNSSLKAIHHHTMSFYYSMFIYYFTLIHKYGYDKLLFYVKQVLHHLNEMTFLVETKNIKIVPLIWQGFIAGCCCDDKSLQDQFRDWAAKLANTGMGSYWGARQVMFEVWKRNANHESGNNWYSVYRDWDMNLMLS